MPGDQNVTPFELAGQFFGGLALLAGLDVVTNLQQRIDYRISSDEDRGRVDTLAESVSFSIRQR